MPAPAHVFNYLVTCRLYGSCTICQVLPRCLIKPHAAAWQVTSCPGGQSNYASMQATQQLESVQKSMKGPVQEAQRGLSGLADQLFHKDQKVGLQTGWVVTRWRCQNLGHAVTC